MSRGNGTTLADQQPATPQPAAPTTRITVNGQTFELRNMSAARGAEFYRAFMADPAIPAASKQEVERIAATIRLVQEVSLIQLPANMDPAGALRRYVEEMLANHGQLPPDAAEWMQEMHRIAEPYLRSMPGYNEAISAGNTAVNVNNFMGYIGWVVGMPGRAVDAVGVMSEEARGFFTGTRYSEAQARAVAAAYVAVRDEERAAAPPPHMFSSVNNFLSSVGTFFNYVAVHSRDFTVLGHRVTWLNWAAPFLMASWEWVTGGFRGDFGALYQQAANSLDEQRASGDVSWSGMFAQAFHANADPTTTVERLRATGSIAGVPTNQIPELIARGGMMRAADGTIRTVEPGGASEPIRGEGGQPITRTDRVGAALNNVVDTNTSAGTESNGRTTSLLLRGATRLVPRIVSMVPFVGVLGTGFELNFMASEEGDAVNGHRLSYVQQLQYDHEHGLINDIDYARFMALQGAYGGSGLLGIGSKLLGAEGAQIGLEMLDRGMMMRYLPPSLTSAFITGDTRAITTAELTARREAHGGQAPVTTTASSEARAEEGIRIAAVDRTEAARQAADQAVRPRAFNAVHRVSLAEVNASGALPGGVPSAPQGQIDPRAITANA